MAAASNFLENKLIDWFFRGQAIGITGASAAAGTGPTALYIALLTGAPTDAGGGTEPTIGVYNYQRVSVTSNTTNWAATNGPTMTTNPSTGTSGTTSNNAVITFNTPTGGDWGTITHFGIYDASSGGNLLFWGVLSASKVVLSGDAVSIQISQLQVQMDD